MTKQFTFSAWGFSLVEKYPMLVVAHFAYFGAPSQISTRSQTDQTKHTQYMFRNHTFSGSFGFSCMRAAFSVSLSLLSRRAAN